MSKIKIEKREISEVAQATINGNLAVFNYKYTKEQLPQKVSFEVYRVSENGNEPMGQALGGSMESNGMATSYHLGRRKRGDGTLIEEIYDICDAIISGTAEIEKEVPPTNSAKDEDVKK